MEISKDRHYIAVSIKHTAENWKFGMPCVLWGYKQTADDEKRCFANYTIYPEKAERYAIGEFEQHGYGKDIVKPEPVKMCLDLCKRYKQYDTVLIDAKQYIGYCNMADLEIEAPKW